MLKNQFHSLFSESIDIENCPCEKVLKCDWSKHLFEMLSQFDATDPLRVKAIALMRKNVCKTTMRQIKCCDLSKENIKETNIKKNQNRRVQVYLSISTRN